MPAIISVSVTTTNKRNFRCNETVPNGFVNSLCDGVFIANYYVPLCESRLRGSIDSGFRILFLKFWRKIFLRLRILSHIFDRDGILYFY